MADTYTGDLNVMATPELNPFMRYAALADKFPDPTVYKIFEWYEMIPPPIVPTIPFDEAAIIDIIYTRLDNDGDEDIEVRVGFDIDGYEVDTGWIEVAPGNYIIPTVTLLAGAMDVGTHDLFWNAEVREAGDPATAYIWYTDSTTYTVEAALCTCTPWVDGACIYPGERSVTRTCTPSGCASEVGERTDPSCVAIGDITKLEINGTTIPEGGTAQWIVGDSGKLTVFFKNEGYVTSEFTISISDEDGHLETITTGSIPAGTTIWEVESTNPIPTTDIEIKTITVRISP